MIKLILSERQVDMLSESLWRVSRAVSYAIDVVWSADIVRGPMPLDDSVVAFFEEMAAVLLEPLMSDTIEMAAKVDGDNAAREQLRERVRYALEQLRPVKKGDALAALLNDTIDGMVTDDRSRADIVEELADAADITESTVNEILTGAIACPTMIRLRGFSAALGLALDDIVAAAEADGCTYGEDA